MNIKKISELNLPKKPGVYKFINGKKIIYIGKASDLKTRVLSYWRKGANHSPIKNKMLKEIKKIEWIETDSEIEALLLEANLIKKIKPKYNILMRDDKRHIYIRVSTEDEIPGIFITRKLEKSGKYFGPFTSVEPVRQTLKAVRKIWPYCMERKKKIKPCFYYQINRCLGVCSGVVNKKEYMEKVIKPIIMFFEGKRKKVVRDLKKKEKEAIKKKNIAEKERIEFKIKNMEMVLEHTRILSIADKYANDVVELAKVLGLPKVPKRIEGYDISNIFGQEAVGSMVVFSEGEAEKQEYRKFKIKIGNGKANLPVGKAGDTGMLKEILERRLNNDWQLPDLIIVDGGKAQLNVAVRVLKKHKLNILVIAISKGLGLRSAMAPDKLFFPGEKKPLELPLASPALHLIKRVRDEAHRFAISYHRKLKAKKLIKR